MTDNEIIKALECCVGCACKECPLHNEDDVEDVTCKDRLIMEALYLINQQEYEIEKLRKYKHDYYVLKAEAIKEFAERLKQRLIEGGIYPVLVKNNIDDLVKEMTEGKQ